MSETLANLDPNYVDPNKFTGDGLICVLDQKLYENRPENERFDYMMNVYGKKCRENCMTPEKICPIDCLCRWYKL